MLKPFEYTDLAFLDRWVTDPRMLFQFSGTTFSYPVTMAQLEQYQQKYPDRKFYIGYTADNVPFAFGEIIPQEDNSVRLARLLIGDPTLRGRGLGQYFIKLLLSECVTAFGTNTIDLFVWENNDAAIRCYKKVGFEFMPVEPFTIVFGNEPYNLLKMTIRYE